MADAPPHPAALSAPSDPAPSGVSALAPQFDLAVTAASRRSAPPIGSLSPQGVPFGKPDPAHFDFQFDPLSSTAQQHPPLRSPTTLVAKDFLQEAESHTFDFRSPRHNSHPDPRPAPRSLPARQQPHPHAYSTSAAALTHLQQHHARPQQLSATTDPPQSSLLHSAAHQFDNPQPPPPTAADFDLFGLAALDLGPPVFEPSVPSPSLRHHQPPSSHLSRAPIFAPADPSQPSHLSFDPPAHHHAGPPPSTAAPTIVSPLPLGSHASMSPTSRSPREQPHPTRCVLLRNIPPGIDDDDIRCLLQVYGPLRDLGAQQRSRGGRGSVLATYFDLRHARTAVRALDTAVHFGRRLDARFQCPTDAPLSAGPGGVIGGGGGAMMSPPSNGAVGGNTNNGNGSPCANQGTLVVFNLDNSTSAEDIRTLFSTVGDVKEIRATPNKKHHKFVEFYDIRDAEKAMRLLNKTEVAGKRIKIEISRPGGRASNLTRHASAGSGKPHQAGATVQQVHLQQRFAQSASQVQFSPDVGAFRIASPRHRSVENNHGQGQHVSSSLLSSIHQGIPPSQHTGFGHSSPEMSPFDGHPTIGSGLASFVGSTGFDAGSNQIQPASYDGSYGKASTSQELDFGSLHSSYDALSEARITPPSGIDQRSSELHQMYTNHVQELNKFSTASMMPRSGSRYAADSYIQALYSSPESEDSRKAVSPLQSPSGRSPFAYGKSDGPGTDVTGISLYKNPFGDDNSTGHSFASQGNQPGSSNQTRRIGGSQSSVIPIGGDRGYAQRQGNSKGIAGAGNKSFSNQQQQGNSKYALDIRKVRSGEETRTALMIRNIPNKYNQKMLLSTLEEEHRGHFDFIYLPIDFKNKCNVGYAFINFTKPQYIEPFYHAFHGKKWGRFNSEKNSSLLLEDPKCRPVIFDAKGRQEEFPIGSHVRTRRGPSSRDASHRACEVSPPYSPPKHRGRS